MSEPVAADQLSVASLTMHVWEQERANNKVGVDGKVREHLRRAAKELENQHQKALESSREDLRASEEERDWEWQQSRSYWWCW